ncbi:hypothetical protein AMS68_005826 [Peltaster fructicola]|uniref:Uncharacterized protein n=1 Tax=Peltaster fructicola TaxID=286661 RepID=A0A6H0Y0B7_9PEZI|nr:hypothetical protein AMS68_005826 [Peltaster fructicola]
MSALLKSLTVLSGLTVTGAAAVYSTRQQTDFSTAALKTGELDVSIKEAIKPRLPSEFFSFTLRDYKISNAA